MNFDELDVEMHSYNKLIMEHADRTILMTIAGLVLTENDMYNVFDAVEDMIMKSVKPAVDHIEEARKKNPDAVRSVEDIVGIDVRESMNSVKSAVNRVRKMYVEAIKK